MWKSLKKTWSSLPWWGKLLIILAAALLVWKLIGGILKDFINKILNINDKGNMTENEAKINAITSQFPDSASLLSVVDAMKMLTNLHWTVHLNQSVNAVTLEMLGKKYSTTVKKALLDLFLIKTGNEKTFKQAVEKSYTSNYMRMIYTAWGIN